MADYTTLRVTTSATTAVSVKSGGVTTITDDAATTYDFTRIYVDAANDILTGWTSSGDEYTFEQASALSVSLITV